ncbi:MAG: LysE family translocator [Calditrichaeota bacterium]|nr:MAG: LysE family translocator [Calditrichota bacterium]MBL1207252.1 LysE family translocator [Calditrichota bacterium]NOG47085.1 LysE family translocator [Calditrichota bacterium]
MTFYTILSLAGAMFLLALTPGPGAFTSFTSSLKHGFNHAIPIVIGIVIGDIFFLLMAIYGLSAIADSIFELFIIIKYLGGGYLIWLGINSWRSNNSSTVMKEPSKISKSSGFLTGLSITLSNPKVILFYLGFLPTFVNLRELTRMEVAIIAIVVSVVLASVMLFYAYSASKAKQLFSNKTTQRKMNRIAGSALITTGAVLIVKT